MFFEHHNWQILTSPVKWWLVYKNIRLASYTPCDSRHEQECFTVLKYVLPLKVYIILSVWKFTCCCLFKSLYFILVCMKVYIILSLWKFTLCCLFENLYYVMSLGKNPRSETQNNTESKMGNKTLMLIIFVIFVFL